MAKYAKIITASGKRRIQFIKCKFTYAWDYCNVSCYSIQKLRCNCDLKIAHMFRKMYSCIKNMLYVIHVVCLCMPTQTYMLNTSKDAKMSCYFLCHFTLVRLNVHICGHSF